MIAEQYAALRAKSRLVCAFVTFDQAEHSESLARLYSGTRNSRLCGACCQRRRLRFRGTHPLLIERAAEPSNQLYVRTISYML